MSRDNYSCGRNSEEAAARFLAAQGLSIISRNYKSRSAEIDIIAREKDTICFVEVKSRKDERFGTAAESVTPAKQRKISEAALSFLKENNLFDRRCRFDVVAISLQDGKEKIEYIRDAFIAREE